MPADLTPPASPAPAPSKAAKARTVLVTFNLAPGPRTLTREATVIGGKGDLLELVVPPQGPTEKPMSLGLVRHRPDEGRPTPPFWFEADEVEEPEAPATRGKK